MQIKRLVIMNVHLKNIYHKTTKIFVLKSVKIRQAQMENIVQHLVEKIQIIMMDVVCAKRVHLRLIIILLTVIKILLLQTALMTITHVLIIKRQYAYVKMVMVLTMDNASSVVLVIMDKILLIVLKNYHVYNVKMINIAKSVQLPVALVIII